MSKDKGIFEPQEGFAAPTKSPFAPDDQGSSPFGSPPPETRSPFSEAAESGGGNRSPFGYGAPSPEGNPASPFGEAPAAVPSGSSSFAGASAPQPEASPFAVADDPAPAAPGPPPSVPPAASPSNGPAPPPMTPPMTPPERSPEEIEWSSIRQLELRAIFGVDRELTEPEILQRARTLPGVRQLARVAAADAGAVDSMKRLVRGLGLGEGQVRIYCGSSPIDFVREGPVLLAVQTDGGFAPGVRETLIIVARELAKL